MREQVEALEHHADAGTLGSDLLIVTLMQHAIVVLAVTEQLSVDEDATSTDVLEHVQASQER